MNNKDRMGSILEGLHRTDGGDEETFVKNVVNKAIASVWNPNNIEKKIKALKDKGKDKKFIYGHFDDVIGKKRTETDGRAGKYFEKYPDLKKWNEEQWNSIIVDAHKMVDDMF
jgi:hypothetical protein